MKVVKSNNNVFYFFIISGIIGVLVSVYYLFIAGGLDLSSSLSSLKVADIGETRNDVRLKRSGNLHWTAVSIGESELLDGYDGDMVFSGNDSKAEIVYKDTKITLNENSLITLSDELIEVDKGLVEFNTKKSSKLRVKVGKELIDLKNSEKILVRKEKDKSTIIPLNKSAEALKNKIKFLKVESNSISLLAPRAGTQFSQGANEIITFQWKSQKKISNTKIQIFRKSNVLVKSINMKDNESETNVKQSEIGVGSFRWLVIADNIESDASSFSIKAKDIPVEFKTNIVRRVPYEDKAVVKFSWDGLKIDEKTLLVSDNKDFNTPIINENVKSEFFQANLSPGNYYWKLVFKGDANTSEINKFRIDSKPYNPQEIKFTRFVTPLDFSKAPRFTYLWKEVAGASEYRFKIENESKAVISVKTKGTFSRVKKIGNGNYTLSVEALTSEGVVIARSDKEILVDTKIPAKAKSKVKPKAEKKKAIPPPKPKAPMVN